MRKTISKDICSVCGKAFTVSIERFASKVDEKRNSYYCCPYCNNVVRNITLMGNEEIYTYKI